MLIFLWFLAICAAVLAFNTTPVIIMVILLAFITNRNIDNL